MEKITMKRVNEILRLRFESKMSIRRSAKLVGVSNSTASQYCKSFEELNMEIKEFLSLNETKQEELLFAKTKTTTKSKNHKKPLPDVAHIHEELKKHKKDNLTLKLLWEEYKQEHPNGYGYTQFGDYYRRYKKRLNPSMRQVHLPGDKLFVDYSGKTVTIYDTKNNQTTKAQIFVAVLGASGYTFVHATPSQKKEDFIYSHTLAYSFFGGTPKIVVPDNLKSAVTYNSKKGILINESYADLARHYNTVVEPTRPYRPKDKAKAEQGVLGIQRWILMRLRKMKFFSVDELNIAIGKLIDDYNLKVIKHLNKSRTKLFDELDKPYLQPLPANNYIYKEFKIARVNQDYHIALDNRFYSVPFKYLKYSVEVRYSNSTVEIWYKSTLIATHPRLYHQGDTSTLKEHMPKSHQYQSEVMNPDRLKRWAATIGEDTKTFVDNLLESVPHPPNTYRKIIAILSLEKIYGKEELNLAIAYALLNNTLYTKSIKSILDKKLYLSKSANNTDRPKTVNTHENLRGNIYK